MGMNGIQPSSYKGCRPRHTDDDDDDERMNFNVA